MLYLFTDCVGLFSKYICCKLFNQIMQQRDASQAFGPEIVCCSYFKMLQMCWLLLTCTLKCVFVFLYSRCMLCSLCNIFGFWNLTFSVQFLGEKKSATRSSPSSFSCVFYLDDWLVYTHLSWHWEGLCMFSCNLSPLHSSRMTAILYALLWQHGSGKDNFLPESALGENSPRY